MVKNENQKEFESLVESDASESVSDRKMQLKNLLTEHKLQLRNLLKKQKEERKKVLEELISKAKLYSSEQNQGISQQHQKKLPSSQGEIFDKLEEKDNN